MTSKEAEAAERAEFIQSVKALFIPLSLFLACVIMAAGTFLIYSGESCGWCFVAVSSVMVVTSFIALIRFQNKYRLRGIIKSEITQTGQQISNEEANLLVFDPENHGVGAIPRPLKSARTTESLVTTGSSSKVTSR